MQLNQKRSIESYPEDIRKASYLLAFNPDKLIFYGSQAKKPFYLSSGDIDLIEPVQLNKAGELARKFYEIILNIEKTPDCYLADVKSGVDDYYVFDFGSIKDGKWVRDNDSIMQKLKLFKQKAVLKRLLSKGSPEAFFEFEDIVREYQILRWNAEELKRGFKVIRGEKVLLEDTIKDVDSMTKIDCIRFIPSLNRYVEITNYFFISKKKEEFNELKYIKELKLNLFKYYTKGKYFKMLKRLMTYVLLKKDKEKAEKLYKIVNSGLGILYQVCSELDAIHYVIEHYGEKPGMAEQIDGMKYRIGNVFDYKIDESKIDAMIDSISSGLMQKKVAKLSQYISDIVNTYTKKELKAIGFFPLPKEFIP